MKNIVDYNDCESASPSEKLMFNHIVQWFGSAGDKTLDLNGKNVSRKVFFGFGDDGDLGDIAKIMSEGGGDGNMPPLKGFLTVFFKWMARVDNAYFDVLDRHREMFYRDGLGLVFKDESADRIETREEYLSRCAVRLSYRERLLTTEDFKKFFKSRFPEIHSIKLIEESFTSGMRKICIYIMPRVKDKNFKYEDVFSLNKKGLPSDAKLSPAKLRAIKDVLSMHCLPCLRFSVRNVPAFDGSN